MENFIVSARKYRPVTFDMVVGQQSITSTLKNAIRNNTLAQAFLFTGPRGVGKTTCARIMQKKPSTVSIRHPKWKLATNANPAFRLTAPILSIFMSWMPLPTIQLTTSETWWIRCAFHLRWEPIKSILLMRFTCFQQRRSMLSWKHLRSSCLCQIYFGYHRKKT